MAEKLEVGQIHRISDGNGGTLQAKIVDKGNTPPWKIYYKTRKGSKGPFRGKEQEAIPRKFRELMADAA